jgi:hypothetical protein
LKIHVRSNPVARNAYLNHNRLEDVIFLIQYLGLDKNYSLEEGTKPDGVSPSSIQGQWVEVARDHPEFFRVTPKNSVTLVMRYLLRESGSPGPLPIETVQKLMDNAFKLQERQEKRAEVWKIWGTFIAAVVAALTGIAQIVVHWR